MSWAVPALIAAALGCGGCGKNSGPSDDTATDQDVPVDTLDTGTDDGATDLPDTTPDGEDVEVETPTDTGEADEDVTEADVEVETGCTSSAECDDSVDCTTDTCGTDGTCTNTPDDGACTAGVCSATLGCVACIDAADCDDSVACTVDVCETDNTCTSTPDDGSCMGSGVCSATLGCVECLDDAGCDDGLFCNGAETCGAAGACLPAVTVPCDDSISCTDDLCAEDDDLCTAIPVDGSCNDGTFCNGTETCDPIAGDPLTGCVAGTDVTCADTVDCTRDQCSEASLGCTFVPVHTLCDVMTQICDPTLGCITVECTTNEDCDNGLVCDGVETCNGVTCIAGTPVVCADEFSCTDDECSEAAGGCQFTPIDTNCTDGLVCNGGETCNTATGAPLTGCLSGTTLLCDDGLSCTADACSESAGGCTHLPDDTQCDDGDLCNGLEVCNPAAGCQGGVAVNCSDNATCSDDVCIPLTGTCTHTLYDSRCLDTVYCDGTEVCAPGSGAPVTGCSNGTAVDCADTVACTVDGCVESTPHCTHNPDHSLCPGEVCNATSGCVAGTPCVIAGDCDDLQFCNGTEVCKVDLICGPGIPEDCNDSNECTLDGCDESGDECTHAPRDRDGDGYGDIMCGGTDCDDLVAAINPGATEVCDGLDNDCDYSVDFGLLPAGDHCSTGAQCCSGACGGGICTLEWDLCSGLSEGCATSAECCSGRCEPGLSGLYSCVSAWACTPLDDSCTISSECCSTLCSGGTCIEGTCALVDDACATASECCSNICTDNVCDPASAPCEPEGESCTSDGNCCSGFCDPVVNRCAQYTLCSPGGSICLDDADCCTAYCEREEPTDPTGTCLLLGACGVVGTPCTGNRACCSNACVDPGIGYRICVFLSGCRPDGELCNTAADCCSGLCNPSDGGLVNRCDNPPACQPAGEMCGEGATANCCGGKVFCRPTIAGVSRCYGTPVGTCFGDLAPCAFADECCCGLCAPDAVGGLVCCPGGALCVEDGDECTTDSDCCSGFCNLLGICGADEDPCVEIGGSCTVDADCCAGRCLGNICTIPDS